MANVATTRRNPTLERYESITTLVPAEGRFPLLLRRLPAPRKPTELKHPIILPLRQMTRTTRFFRDTPRAAEQEGAFTEVVDDDDLRFVAVRIAKGLKLERCPKSSVAFIAGVDAFRLSGECECAQLTVVFTTPTELNYVRIRRYISGRSTSPAHVNTLGWTHGHKVG